MVWDEVWKLKSGWILTLLRLNKITKHVRYDRKEIKILTSNSESYVRCWIIVLRTISSHFRDYLDICPFTHCCSQHQVLCVGNYYSLDIFSRQLRAHLWENNYLCARNIVCLTCHLEITLKVTRGTFSNFKGCSIDVMLVR